MDVTEALVIITAILVGCWTLVQVLQLVARGVKRLLGVPGPPSGSNADDASASLKAGEVETMIREAVREEVRPLHEKIDRLEQQGGLKDTSPRRDLLEDPHDFGLIADDAKMSGEHAA